MIITIQKIKDSQILTSAYNLSKYSFFVRNSIKEMLNFTTTKIKTTQCTEFVHTFDNKNTYTFFTLWDVYQYIVVVDESYPKHVAYKLLKEMAVNDDYASLMQEYEDYKNKDYLSIVNDELDETKNILKQTLEDVIGRGEKLDMLVRDAEELSTQTKTLFELSKKQNRCFC